MYDQSFSEANLRRHLSKSDFYEVPENLIPQVRNDAVTSALQHVRERFETNQFASFNLKGKRAYRATGLGAELVVRKLTWNLERQWSGRLIGRNTIVGKVIKILEEGVPYRVYRIDIETFFESFGHEFIKESISKLFPLSSLSKDLLGFILDDLRILGCEGLPRGMRISSIISEILMGNFDWSVRNHEEVFFFDRYVDDIVIVTSGNEDDQAFLEWIESVLPKGMALNRKKEKVANLKQKCKYEASPSQAPLRVDYLGYSFTVSNPASGGRELKSPFRKVSVGIAASKETRYKFRISRSILDFNRTGDFPLFVDRVKFLTSNFRISKRGRIISCLAGIYYGYPHLTDCSSSLDNLDRFFKNALFSSSSRYHGTGVHSLTKRQKWILLSKSFKTGHAKKSFSHFHPQQIARIQKCWIYG